MIEKQLWLPSWVINIPITTIINPNEHYKSIKLGSGTTYEGPKMPT